MVKAKYPKVLERFMKEHFDFERLVEIGFFKKEMKNDYQAQADRVCKLFGYDSVFEYGSKELKCHLSYEDPKGKPFITVISSIYD